jgi:hypothetical protein
MMEGFWGMGSTVTSHGVTRQAGIPGGGGKPGEDDREAQLLKGDLGHRIENKLGELLARAEQILAENRLEVLAVAHALESHKTVTGDDVRAIVEGEQGPLLDGRPYHSEEFRQAAEAYHRRVAEAHVRHAKVDAPLPPLPVLELAAVVGDRGINTQGGNPITGNGHPATGPGGAAAGSPVPPPNGSGPDRGATAAGQLPPPANGSGPEHGEEQ